MIAKDEHSVLAANLDGEHNWGIGLNVDDWRHNIALPAWLLA